MISNDKTKSFPFNYILYVIILHALLANYTLHIAQLYFVLYYYIFTLRENSKSIITSFDIIIYKDLRLILRYQQLLLVIFMNTKLSPLPISLCVKYCMLTKV